jgi:hypothetical protein
MVLVASTCTLRAADGPNAPDPRVRTGRPLAIILGRFASLAAVTQLLLPSAAALDNGLARTPLLGWSSWNYFMDDINETLVLDIADGLVASGLRDAGYTYLNLDAGAWSVNRTARGELQPNPLKFPGGLQPLAAKLHSMRLKLGLYINLGTEAASCGRTGSFGHYRQDAKTLAEIGADFVKVDYCGGPPPPPPCTGVPHPCIKPGHTYCLSDPSPGQCSKPPAAHCPPCPPGPPPAPPSPPPSPARDPFVPNLPDQLKAWQALRDALNATGRPIYSYFCPRSFGGSLQRPPPPDSNCTDDFSACGVVDGPPREWSAATRQQLANTILTEYHNSGDEWANALSNLDALLALRPQPDAAGPGFFSDGACVRGGNTARRKPPSMVGSRLLKLTCA